MGIPRNCWKAWLLTFPLAASNAEVCQNATTSQRAVDVLIGNYASVATRILSEAQDEAERILGPAGFDIHWRHPVETTEPVLPSGPLLTIQLLPPAMEARLHRPENEFGFASGSTAFIFCTRLDRVAQTGIPLSPSRLLGSVLAHEIAHMLLGPGAHAQGGIMQPNWRIRDLVHADQGTLKLLPRQIDRLRCSSPPTDLR